MRYPLSRMLCAIVLLCGAVSTLLATTRTVGPGKTYATIEAAVAAAVADDVVEVYAGTYTPAGGRLIIDKSITVRAAAGLPQKPKILTSCTSWTSCAVQIAADNVVLEGLEIDNSAADATHLAFYIVGDYGSARNGWTVRYCDIHNGRNCIRPVGNNITIEYNNLHETQSDLINAEYGNCFGLKVKHNWLHSHHAELGGKPAGVTITCTNIPGADIEISYNYCWASRTMVDIQNGVDALAPANTIIIAHNTVDYWMGPLATPVADENAQQMGIAWWANKGHWDASKFVIRDNLFTRQRGYAVVDTDNLMQGEVNLQQNLFWQWFLHDGYPQSAHEWPGPRGAVGWDEMGAGNGFITTDCLTQDPLYRATGDTPDVYYALFVGSPALHAASDGTHIGAYQGEAVKIGVVVAPDAVSAQAGQTVTLSATLTALGVPLADKAITFSIAGTPVGAATTDAAGVATLAYPILKPAGSYAVAAVFAGDATFESGQGTNTLTVQAPATVYVDKAWAGAASGTQVAPGKFFGANAFATIQSGVNVVAVGGTVSVAGGTYTENVSISKALTVRGEHAATTLVRGASATPGARAIFIAANIQNVTLEGVTIDSNAGQFGLFLAGGNQQVLVQHCELLVRPYKAGNAQESALETSGAITGLTLRDNTFRGLTGTIGGVTEYPQRLLYVGGAASHGAAKASHRITLDGNTFTGVCERVSGAVGLELGPDAEGEGSTVTDNVIDCVGLEGLGINGAGCRVTLSGNTLTTSDAVAGAGGLTLIGAGAVTMSNNTIDGNGAFGLQLDHWAAGTTLTTGTLTFGSALGQAITLDGAGNVNATAATFTGAANDLAIEARVWHQLDDAALGLVTWGDLRTAAVLTTLDRTGTTGGSATLSATLTTATGTPLAQKTVLFSVHGVVLSAAVTNAQGVATRVYPIALGNGTYPIRATFGGDNLVQQATPATASLVVSGHGLPTLVTVTAAPAALVAGAATTLTATARDAAGNTWDVTDATTWTVTPGAGGSWAANGYTSYAAGNWTVSGSYQGKVGTTALAVTPGAAASVTLTPGTATVASGGTVAFTVVARDACGNVLAAPAVAMSDGAADGAFAGLVYTAGAPGSVTITATVGAAAATATVTVTGGGGYAANVLTWDGATRQLTLGTAVLAETAAAGAWFPLAGGARVKLVVDYSATASYGTAKATVLQYDADGTAGGEQALAGELYFRWTLSGGALYSLTQYVKIGTAPQTNATYYVSGNRTNIAGVNYPGQRLLTLTVVNATTLTGGQLAL